MTAARSCGSRDDSVADELAHALPHRVVGAAVATIRELGRVQPDILIHGDLHARNGTRLDRLAEFADRLAELCAA